MMSNESKKAALLLTLGLGMMNDNLYPNTIVGLPPKLEKIIPPEIKEARRKRHRERKLQKKKRIEGLINAEKIRIRLRKLKELK